MIDEKTANVQDRGRNSTAAVAGNVFRLSGYVPVTMEMLLLRYWLAHGRPQSVRLLPGGEAFVEFRDKDTATVSGKFLHGWLGDGS